MTKHDTTHEPHPSTAANKRAVPPRPSPKQAPLYESVEAAAPMLGITEEALRARCRRARRGTGGATVADLGAGIRAVKFGRTWRIQFPRE